MTEKESLTRVDDEDTLLSMVSGTAVRYFEVAAQRDESWSVDDEASDIGEQEVSINLQVRVADDSMDVRLRAEATRPEARMVVDLGVQFKWIEPVEYSDTRELSRRFAEKHGLPYLLSYARPVLDQLSRTLEIPVVSLPLDLTNGNSLILPDSAIPEENTERGSRTRIKG